MDTYDILLYGSYLLVAIGIVAAILLPLINSLDNPKSLLKSAIGIVGIVVLFFIAYSISSNEVLPKFEASPFNLTPAGSQLVGGMLITTYILAIVALGSIVLTEVTKAIK
jgi:NADH:ubiquinone oxidoreductase subunit 6 (subunit J)